MKLDSRTTVLAALAAGFALLAGWTTLNAPQPAVVACVDLENTFNQLDQHKAAEDRIEAMAMELNKQVEQLAQDVQDLEAELDAFQADSPAYLEITRKIESAIGEYRAYESFSTGKIEAEQSEQMRQTYMQIKDALAEMSKERGYDIVFLDDSIPAFERSTATRTIQQISNRKILYANPTMDITQELIEYMNGRFKSRNSG
ncbi:MAG: hypothetical protein CMJ32_11205 [Phycisphaerae bacterium]|nr:hypothetical protein [Phycisphaerae bacterium]